MQLYSNICNYSQAKNGAQSKVISNVGINEHVLSNIIQAFLSGSLRSVSDTPHWAGFHCLEAAQK